MELWIRSQNKETLLKVEKACIVEVYKATTSRGTILPSIKPTGKYKIEDGKQTLGEYKSKKRALEILDEIQKKMVEKYLLKEVEHINYGNMDDLRKYYKRKEINFVEVPNGIELEPINKDILVYEMPEE